MVRCLFIDVDNKTVSWLDLPPDQFGAYLQSVRNALKCQEVWVEKEIDYFNCLFVEDVTSTPRNLKDISKPYLSHFFSYGDAKGILGNGIILGVTEDGDILSPNLSLEEVKAQVKFYDTSEVNGKLIA